MMKKIIASVIILFIFIACASTSKILKGEKKFIKKIEKLIGKNQWEKKIVSYPEGKEFVLIQDEREDVEPAFVKLIVFDDKINIVFESEKKYNKAYWQGDMLILEKHFGQVKPNEDIHQAGTENKLIYQYNPKSKQLQKLEVAKDI